MGRLLEAARSAAAAWNHPRVPCANVTIVVAEPTANARVRNDGVSLLAFRDSQWCHNGRCGGTRTYPLRAAGMTTTFPPRGGLLEGDIELNAVHFRWSAHVPVEGPEASLSGVIAHELGHVLGLPDACGVSHADTRPCEAPPSIMFAAARLDRPTSYDVEMLCALYPRRHSQTGEAIVSDAPAARHLWVSVAVLLAVTLLGVHLHSLSSRWS